MDCERIREQLGLYLDDELSTDAQHGVETHLSTCPKCTNELESVRALAAELAGGKAVTVPEALWASIEERLDQQAKGIQSRVPFAAKLQAFRRPLAAAASVLVVVGLGLLGIAWLHGSVPTAEASTIDFGVLLDALPLDAQKALRRFLTRYDARKIPAHTAHQRAPDLDFEVPESLPGGFRREAVYVLRFGDAAGIAAEYYREDGEFLVALFHPPVQQEDYGTRKDHPCVIGQHRGHTVEVGPWRLVHLTDPTTCHCVLSRLDLERELPAVMAAVAPRSLPSNDHGHDHSGQNHSGGQTP